MLTHLNKDGRARMVDVSYKAETAREAEACGCIYMKRETLDRINEGSIKKGDVLSVAQVGGIMGAKNTPHIIPMCHPIMITGCDMDFRLDFENSKVDVKATVKNIGQTGVEMEALTAVTTAVLTIYDMCKAIDKDMTISEICVVRKSGGKSGVYERTEMEWKRKWQR